MVCFLQCLARTLFHATSGSCWHPSFESQRKNSEEQPEYSSFAASSQTLRPCPESLERCSAMHPSVQLVQRDQSSSFLAVEAPPSSSLSSAPDHPNRLVGLREGNERSYIASRASSPEADEADWIPEVRARARAPSDPVLRARRGTRTHPSRPCKSQFANLSRVHGFAWSRHVMTRHVMSQRVVARLLVSHFLVIMSRPVVSHQGQATQHWFGFSRPAVSAFHITLCHIPPLFNTSRHVPPYQVTRLSNVTEVHTGSGDIDRTREVDKGHSDRCRLWKSRLAEELSLGDIVD